MKTRLSALAIALSFPMFVAAAQIDGISFTDTVPVGGKALTINGVALNKVLAEKIYVAALYVPSVQTTEAQVIAAPGPKRLEIVFLRPIPAKGLSRNIVTSIRESPDQKALTQNYNDLAELGLLLDRTGARAAKDRVTLDWIPERGIEVRVNDKLYEPIIKNEAIYRLLLSTFIGSRAREPVRTGLLAGGLPTSSVLVASPSATTAASTPKK
jgi:hypothetical protein